MRKSPIVLLFYVLLLGLAACSRAPQPSASPAAATTTPAPVDTAPPPTATAIPSPTPEPTPGPITPLNAANLTVSNSFELSFEPSGLVWSSNGGKLAVIGYKDLLLLNAAGLSPVKQITLPEEATLLDFSSDGHTMATTLDFQTITLTDIRTDQVTATISPGVRFVAASFSPDGSQMVAGSGEEWAAMIFNAANGELLDTITGFETAAPVYDIHFGTDGASLVWMARGTIQVEQIMGQTLGTSIGHEDFISAYQLAHSGSLLATAAGGTHNGEFTPLIFLWDPASGAKIAELVLPQPAYGLDFSPDDRLLAVCAGDDLLLWDAASHMQVFTAAAHPGGAWAARFAPDGTALATVGADRSLKLWTID
jgi:WD40 repeat protein